MKVLYDINTFEYIFEDFDDIQYGDAILKIGFRQDGGLPVYFDEMSMRLSIFFEDTRVLAVSIPEADEVYVETDQDYVWGYSLYGIVIPDKNYVLELSITNGGREEFVIQPFKIGRPEKNFPSWIWNDEVGQYDPPVPYPSDGESYSWDEESQTWNLIVE